MKKIIILSSISILLFSGCSIGRYNGLTAKKWAEESTSCEYELNNYRNKLFDYQAALEEANYNIEKANQIIEEAKGYAGATYNDMDYILSNLETVDTVDEPY